MAWTPLRNDDTVQAEGIVLPIRIASFLRAEFVDVASIPMRNKNAVAMLAFAHDTYHDEIRLSLVYRYLTDSDLEENDAA